MCSCLPVFDWKVLYLPCQSYSHTCSCWARQEPCLLYSSDCGSVLAFWVTVIFSNVWSERIFFKQWSKTVLSLPFCSGPWEHIEQMDSPRVLWKPLVSDGSGEHLQFLAHRGGKVAFLLFTVSPVSCCLDFRWLLGLRKLRWSLLFPELLAASVEAGLQEDCVIATQKRRSPKRSHSAQSRGALCPVLLDQTIFAGLGNCRLHNV